MDMKEVSRLQIGRIRSLACRTTAVIAVADNDGGKTPGVDGETWGDVSKMTPSKSARKRIQGSLRDSIREKESREEVVKTLNPKLKGWCQYYASSNHSIKAFAKRDHYLYERIVKWERDRRPKLGRKERRRETGDGTWTWRTKEGRTRFRPISMKCEYPSYKRLNQWNRARRTHNPYDAKPGKLVKRP